MATCAACGLEIAFRSEIRADGFFLLHRACIQRPREIWVALRSEREIERLRRDLFEKQEVLGNVRQDRTRLEGSERNLRRRVEELEQTVDAQRSRAVAARNRADELEERIGDLNAEVTRLTQELSRLAAPAQSITPVVAPTSSGGSDTDEPVENDDSTTRYSLLELDT